MRTHPSLSPSQHVPRGALLRVLLCVLLGALLAASCGTPCRGIETRALDFECSASATFTGELHFDSRATFDTFLRQQCLSIAQQDTVDALLDEVDFDTEAVFVAAGPHRLDDQRCLVTRELDGAQVCTTGLKIYFADQMQRADAQCPGTRWTVAFALPREELRAAVEAGRQTEAR